MNKSEDGWDDWLIDWS